MNLDLAMTDAAVPLEVDCRAVKTRLDEGRKFLFLDCREPEEFAIAKIAGATLIPMSQLVERVGEIEGSRDAEVIIHCHHGGRSLRVANWLRNQGYAKASSMAGGIDKWAMEIDPTIARY